MEFTIKSIGMVHNSIQTGVDNNWGEVTSEIHISPEFVKGLEGLKEFSHILVVFYMHKSSFDYNNDLVRRPQGRDDMPNIGIFAQRAKHRPNPIGVSVVRLVDIKEGVLIVNGLDAIDETPIIDIKPYFPVFDESKDVLVPQWINILMKDYF
jgi:tRNA-Thr(GGU) m(6)t(6)A37 methyltransferase TsaA